MTKFEFYIVDRSFKYRQRIEKKELEGKIESLALDYEYIRQYKDTDDIFVNPSIYQETIFPGFTVEKFLYNPESKNFFDRDSIQYLATIIDKSKQTTIKTEEVVDELLPRHSEKNVFGLICLHEIEGIEEKYLVYNKNNWIAFHRHFLSLYFQNSNFFMDECVKYFPKLHFHPNNKYQEEPVYCELHLKLLYNDLKKIEQNRIYFHEGKSHIQNGNILIGYIGEHL